MFKNSYTNGENKTEGPLEHLILSPIRTQEGVIEAGGAAANGLQQVLNVHEGLLIYQDNSFYCLSVFKTIESKNFPSKTENGSCVKVKSINHKLLFTDYNMCKYFLRHSQYCK